MASHFVPLLQDTCCPVPTLWTRKDRPEPGSEAATAAARSKKSDARDFLEEVDLPKKLKSSEYSTLVASEKWSEQLKALQLVIDALGPTPKIKSGCDVHEVVAACKNFLRIPGSHLTVLVASLRVLALLAEGMRLVNKRQRLGLIASPPILTPYCSALLVLTINF